jgi:2,3-dihydro-2,3-dihydroxybenzoate dehydrogenase
VTGTLGMAGRVALVTGAAGGIGAAVVEALAREGVVVAAADRAEQTLKEQVELLVADGLRAEAFGLDITSSQDVAAVVDEVERRLGPIDYLVNGAGVLRLGTTRELTDDDWASTFAVNATGTFYVSRAVIERMAGRRSGAVVTIASNAAGTPRTEMAAYAASKAAAAMFTKCLGLEAAEYGIRCNVVAPGSTDTAMLTSLWKDGAGPESSIAGTPSAYKLGIPLRKIAQPADVAAAVLFLLSDQAGHITMHDLTVDGGATLGV